MPLHRSRLDTTAAQQLITRTYYALRWGLGIAAAALPIVLIVGEKVIHNGPLPDTVSGYFHTGMRTIWTGTLVLIAVFLYLYKGFSARENYVLNAAGCGVLGVVLLPCATDGGSTDHGGFTFPAGHAVSAAVAFAGLAVVAIFFGADTLDLIPDARQARRLRIAYRVIGVLMIVLPLVSALSRLTGAHWVFWVEAAAIWVFAAYWFVKTVEFRVSDADSLAIYGTLPAVRA